METTNTEMNLSKFISTAKTGKKYKVIFHDIEDEYFNILYENNGIYLQFEYNDGTTYNVPTNIINLWNKLGIFKILDPYEIIDINNISVKIYAGFISKSNKEEIIDIIDIIQKEYSDIFEICDEDAQYGYEKDKNGVDLFNYPIMKRTITINGNGLEIKYIEGKYYNISVDDEYFEDDYYYDAIEEEVEVSVEIVNYDDKYGFIYNNKISELLPLEYFEDSTVTVIGD